MPRTGKRVDVRLALPRNAREHETVLVIGAVAHEPSPKPEQPPVGTRHEVALVQKAIVRRRERVVEEHATGRRRGKPRELVGLAKHVEKGRSPRVAAAVGVPRLRDPEGRVWAGAVAQRLVVAAGLVSHVKRRVARRLVGVPVVAKRGTALGDPSVDVVAEHVGRLVARLEQPVTRHKRVAQRMHKRQAGEPGRHWVHRPARPHEQDARVLPPHHAIERVLVLGIAVRNVGSAVRVRRPHERYVRLVAELHRRDGRTQLARCVKQHPHLRRVPRARAPKRAALLVAKPRQHGKRHKQLAADRADEVEHAPPLRKRQHGSVWSGCRAACVAVKVVVGARGPRAAHADPRRADGAREHAQPFISQVDGPAPGHEVLRVTKQR